jgi:erythromycin esterase
MSSRDDFVAWVRGAAQCLDGTDLNSDDRDLAPFADLVGSARIVGLGESWHCIREFLAVRFRLVRYLVERLGFTAVLFEGSLATSRVLDDYVSGGNAEPVLSVLWDNAETRRFLTWLRSHNEGAERRVRALGVDTHILIMDDVHRPGAAFESVVEFLRRVDSAYTLPHVDVVRRIFADFPRGDVVANFSYISGLDPDDRARLRQAFTAAVAQLRRHRADYAHRGSPAELAWASQRAAVLLQALDVYETPPGHGFSVRDLAMAENVQWSLDHLGPDTRAVVLAHTAHLARAPGRVARSDAMQASMGARLADWHGADYVALTTTFGDGELTAPHPITQALDIAPGSDDSIDLAVRDAGHAPSLLDLRGAAGQPWLAVPRPHRTMANLGWELVYRFPNAIDGLIHIDRIQLAR